MYTHIFWDFHFSKIMEFGATWVHTARYELIRVTAAHCVDREFYVYRFGRPRPGRTDGRADRGGRKTDAASREFGVQVLTIQIHKTGTHLYRPCVETPNKQATAKLPN